MNKKQYPYNMSINEKGLGSKIKGSSVEVEVKDNHPLLILGNSLPWYELFGIIVADLKSSTAKGKWWYGRGLKVRIHLGVYILQQLFNKKDREIENDIKEKAVYQIFCGYGIIDKWHCPDHTKIEEFRSRLKPKTQQILANTIAKIAVELGFAKPEEMDIDSTIQEANITYPSDKVLMVKLATIAHKVGSYLNKTFFPADFWQVDLKTVRSIALQCFYDKGKSLIDLWSLAHGEVSRISRACEIVGKDLPKLPWFIANSLRQLQEYGSSYFVSIIPWILRGEVSKDKALSFHLKEVSCFNKKAKVLQFGRSHQLGRLKGNFIIIGHSDKVRMEDHASLPVMLEQHQQLFGLRTLNSVATDRGYASKENRNILIDAEVREIGMQLQSVKEQSSLTDIETTSKLKNRRAGIEPLIGHLKHGWQMSKSRMKKDASCLSSAYTSVLGFNLRQLMRYQRMLA